VFVKEESLLAKSLVFFLERVCVSVLVCS
jgi:hypothetical protein